MFRTGELVEHRDSKKLGLVLETKEKYLDLYCLVMWLDREKPEWTHHHRVNSI
mgnify:CR=1